MHRLPPRFVFLFSDAHSLYLRACCLHDAIGQRKKLLPLVSLSGCYHLSIVTQRRTTMPDPAITMSDPMSLPVEQRKQLVTALLQSLPAAERMWQKFQLLWTNPPGQSTIASG